MLESKAAAGFSALGNPTRLAIFRILVQAGEDGLAIGAVQRTLDVPLSTLSHHLSALVRAGLVIQEKAGREVLCTADYERLNSLIDYLKANCCAGIGPDEDDRRPSLAVEEVRS